MGIKWVDVEKIRLDGGTQPRIEIDQEVVEEYSTAMTQGAKFPAVDIYFDGENYWLADGYHRVLAIKGNWPRVKARVHEGTQRDAILHSVGANATHGLRRSNADKRAAVEKLLRDDDWVKWSDNAIAERVSVSNQLVRTVRSKLERLGEIKVVTERLGADGRAIDTSKIGQSKPAPTPTPADPEADGQKGEAITVTLYGPWNKYYLALDDDALSVRKALDLQPRAVTMEGSKHVPAHALDLDGLQALVKAGVEVKVESAVALHGRLLKQLGVKPQEAGQDDGQPPDWVTGEDGDEYTFRSDEIDGHRISIQGPDKQKDGSLKYQGLHRVKADSHDGHAWKHFRPRKLFDTLGEAAFWFDTEIVSVKTQAPVGDGDGEAVPASEGEDKPEPESLDLRHEAGAHIVTVSGPRTVEGEVFYACKWGRKGAPNYTYEIEFNSLDDADKTRSWFERVVEQVDTLARAEAEEREAEEKPAPTLTPAATGSDDPADLARRLVAVLKLWVMAAPDEVDRYIRETMVDMARTASVYHMDRLLGVTQDEVEYKHLRLAVQTAIEKDERVPAAIRDALWDYHKKPEKAA